MQEQSQSQSQNDFDLTLSQSSVRMKTSPSLRRHRSQSLQSLELQNTNITIANPSTPQNLRLQASPDLTVSLCQVFDISRIPYVSNTYVLLQKVNFLAELI